LSIVVTVNAGLFPYGNPASLGEPLGIWTGEANVTGDASGGFIQVSFAAAVAPLPDERRQYIFFCDGLSLSATTDPGSISGAILTHWARANSALGDRFRHQISRPSLNAGGGFFPQGPLMETYMTRMPIFFDEVSIGVSEVRLIQLNAETNTLATVYLARAYGRYYDRQILSNRSFGRLISPPPIAPGD